MSKYIIINEREEIYLENADRQITDFTHCKEVINNLHLSEAAVLSTEFSSEKYIVEAFDFPLIGHKISVSKNKILIHTKHDLIFEADPKQWSLGLNDEFFGATIQSVPFKLTEQAQNQLFELCDEFDDESFTLAGVNYATPSYFLTNDKVASAEFWTEAYQQKVTPNWDLQQPAEGFKDILPRLKLPKSRILVLGCGAGHDAALFAQAGHVVTAVDFSGEAIQQAKKNYGHLTTLQFEQMDVFNLPQDWNFTFDLVIEHTLFCAIKPADRKKLITVWKRLLHEEGQLLSVFFSMFKRTGPPYGATELELRSLLSPDFQFLFWGRLRNSVPARLGKELFVLAKKR